VNGSGRASGSTSHGGITPSMLWGKLGYGKTSVIVLAVFDHVTMLLQAGAEVRPLGQTSCTAKPGNRSYLLELLRGV
jgi:hypothetical protein